MFRKIGWMPFVAVLTSFGVFAYIVLSFLNAYGYFDRSTPHFLFSHMSFPTPKVSTYTQRYIFYSNVRTFFESHPEYNLPDSINIDFESASGEGCLNQTVYLTDSPTEIYRLVFFEGSTDTSEGESYIGDLYTLNSNRQFEQQSNHNWGSVRKKQVLTRLENEILNKIKWTASE